MSQWLYNGEPYEPPEDFTEKDLYGFVYIIENLANGKSYIGKKLFFHSRTRQVKKKKKRYKVESDWREYYGSSESLLKDVEHYGKGAFRRTILHLCKSKGEASYLEMKEQVVRDVLLRDDYYNTWISARVRTSHLTNLREIYSSQEQVLFRN